MKSQRRAALVNDITGFGRCSITVELPIVSALKVEACPFPTALLSVHTAFPNPFIRDETSIMRPYMENWKEHGVEFEGISTGFLGSEAQVDIVSDFIHLFKKKDTLVIVDPVMGDDGFTYANFSPDLLRDMRVLADYADILTPNITELCLLTDADPEKLLSSSAPTLLEQIRARARSLLNKPGKTILVTGLSDALCRISASTPACDLKIDAASATACNTKIGNLLVNSDAETMYLFPHEKGHFSGTGDLFAAAVLGGRLNGWSWDRTIRTAGSFLSAGVQDSVRAGTSSLEGIDYEKHLSMLMHSDPS